MKIITNFMINKAMKIAEDNFNEGNTDTELGFDFEGQWIINPWMDPSGRLNLSQEEAKKIYGDENINNFILNANK